MVISHRYRFIFVHIPKTAGTSCALALKQGLPWWERRQRQTRRGSKHKSLLDGLELLEQPTGLFRHGVRDADSYFSFAVVRNPWDRMVSLYHYLKRTEKYAEICPDTFEAFLDDIDAQVSWTQQLRSLRTQRSYLADADGRMICDRIARFETLAQDFEAITQRLGIDARLPHVNRSNHDAYVRYYTPRSRECVARWYRQDIDEFGYTFDGLVSSGATDGVGAEPHVAA
ncbi:Sulfotransferase family protein [Maioricimonas rarisocia]|uniref:Sulfotransferase family protein n=1 Tax=Maioricimonas rarisocia TaxID=2528026 RepID=A0A517Z356_9PLAN|nr:sulfotransferase family 2 domain-containing protein [Maioricimonas rarisocia]QDU36901.1 Sulfotransferase family protein [Maioricimonas rarisocia]